MCDIECLNGKFSKHLKNSSIASADKLIEIVNGKLDEIWPEEDVRVSQLDGKIISLSLQKLKRLKQKEYTKHGCSTKYKMLKKKVKYRVKKEGNKAISKMLENATGKGRKWIQEANRLR